MASVRFGFTCNVVVAKMDGQLQVAVSWKQYAYKQAGVWIFFLDPQLFYILSVNMREYPLQQAGVGVNELMDKQ